MEYVRGTVLNLNWVSVKFFTEGWTFFFQQESLVLALLCGAMGLLDLFILENTFSCWVQHCMLIIFIRRVVAGGISVSSKRVDGQTIVITGCNVGIGKETARDLSRRGAKVIMACRDTKTAQKVSEEIHRETGGELVVMKLDLASLASVRNFANDLKAKEKKIHMLINNAGIMMCPLMRTEDGFEMQIGTNHFGHFLLTNLLLPLLTHSEYSRIINLSSVAHLGGRIPFHDINYEKGYNRIAAYSNSKVANILFTRHLAKKLQGSNIKVFSVHPGSVQSNLARHISGGFQASFFAEFFFKKTLEGAQTTLYCALEAEQNNEHYYFSDCDVGWATPYARSDEVAERLWDLSEEMVGLKK